MYTIDATITPRALLTNDNVQPNEYIPSFNICWQNLVGHLALHLVGHANI